MVEMRSGDMIRTHVPRWLPALLVLVAVPAAAADDEETRLAKGEVVITTRAVKGSETPETTGKAVIDAPPAKVWSIVSRCADYHRTMPRIKASKEVSRNGGKIVCEVTIIMPAPYSNLTATTDVTHVEAAPKFTRSWKLISGDYKINQGSWVLTPYKNDPKRTLAIYTVLAEPKVYIPGWIRKAAQKKSLPEMMERLRQQTK
jgi:ribosome-associated toxin RatA of RatAB toxin-antitoxin module